MTHQHKFEKKGRYYLCECGKKRLIFEEAKGIRKDGKGYTKKANQNRFFFPEEYMKLEDNLKPKQKHSVKCLLNTGARISELKKVQVQDFIFNSQGRSRIILRHTKTKARKGEFLQGKVRDVPLSKEFAKYLNNFVKTKKLKPMENLKILTNPAINNALKNTANLIGLSHPEDFSCHTLRKTFEIWLMALGVDSLPLTAHLGHDIRTAASNYVSPDIFSWEDKNKIKKIIGDLYQR
jgi:integrase